MLLLYPWTYIVSLIIIIARRVHKFGNTFNDFLPVLVCFSCCGKTETEGNPGEGRVYLSCRLQSIICGSWGRNLEQKPWRNTALLVCFQAQAQLPFFYSPGGPPADGCCTHIKNRYFLQQWTVEKWPEASLFKAVPEFKTPTPNQVCVDSGRWLWHFLSSLVTPFSTMKASQQGVSIHF